MPLHGSYLPLIYEFFLFYQLFNWDRKFLIFQKDSKGLQTWTVTDAIWGESHLLFWDFLQWFNGKESISMQESQEMQVEYLSWEDPLEEEMATHSRILARITLWTEKPGGLHSLGSQRVRHNWVTEHTHTTLPPARSSHGNSEYWWKV